VAGPAEPFRVVVLQDVTTTPTRRWGALLAGAVAAVTALALLDGGVAGLAQRAALAEAARYGLGRTDLELYSLTGHVLAMLAVAAVAVATATGLAATDLRPLAACVLAGAVTGPMTVAAAPVAASLVAGDSGDTRWWWHVAVALAQLVVMAAATWWTFECLRRPDAVADHRGVPWATRSVSAAAVFTLVAVAGFAVQVVVDRNGGSQGPGVLAMLGWAILAGGLVTAVGWSVHWWASFAALVGVGAALGLMYAAYHRPGGWPGVAGWEVFGQSPLVLTVGAAVTLLVAPFLGMVAQLLRHPATVPRPWSPPPACDDVLGATPRP
jgi:hypothetical protein